MPCQPPAMTQPLQCGGGCLTRPNWTAPFLKSRIHRSCLLINVCRVSAVPSLPREEKVADRPEEGACVEGSVLKRPPHPPPLPQFFARTLPCDTTLYPQKNRGRGEQHGAVQLRCLTDHRKRHAVDRHSATHGDQIRIRTRSAVSDGSRRRRLHR